MNVIEVKNLKKHFGKIRALDGVSFNVQKGEIFGFLGPNGAGKTTAIRCIMDFIRPTSGNVLILEKDANLHSVELKKHIGYLTSDLRLYDNWNGRDHIDLIEAVRGKLKNLSQLVKLFGFNQKIKVKKLSTGNKQKLGLILALMNEPEILILDEPTRGLDPILQNAFYKIILELKEKGVTIFMSSHNLPEVEKVCDRVAIIKNGKLVALEDIQTIRKKKIHVVTVYFEEKFSTKDFELKNVEITQKFSDGLEMRVKGDINPLMKKISGYKVKDLEITHENLEESFLEFYK